MNTLPRYRLPGFGLVMALGMLIALPSCDRTPPPPPEPPPVPDLTISIDDGLGGPVEPGQGIVYRLAYANVGDTAATGVTITATVPEGTSFDATRSDTNWNCTGTSAGATCTFSVERPAGGASGEVAFAVRVDDPHGADLAAIVQRTVIADAGGTDDPTPGNNTATVTTPVAPKPEPPPQPVFPAAFCDGCAQALAQGWIDSTLVDDYRRQCNLCAGPENPPR